MTVIVTGGSGLVGRAVIPALTAGDPEVRAVVRRPESADELRSLGAKVAIGRLDSADGLAEVMHGIHTVVHLVGGLNQPDDDAILDANQGSTLVALQAAKLARVKRFLFLSYPGASPGSENTFLRAKGLAEEAIGRSGLEYAIVRSAHIFGVGGLWFTAVVQGGLASPPIVVGAGDQQLAPVFVDDVAAVLVAADDRKGELEGIWELEGPDTISADGLVQLLSGAEVAPEHVSTPDRLGQILGIPVSSSAFELLASSSLAPGASAAAEFGVKRTSLADGIRTTLERAATRLER